MSITVIDVHLDRLQGPKDEYIMQANHLQRYSPSHQRDINLVRIWLLVSTLADMADPDRPNRIKLTYLDAKRPTELETSTTWPRQTPPTKSQIRLWKRFITSSYLRYTPYWKTTPASRSTASAPVPIVPTSQSRDY
jgi:hypothetical protein